MTTPPASPVDPNAVMMTGENSFVRLSPDGGKTQTDRYSHWRVLWCPDGAGHVLFAKGALTGDKVRIWSDNEAVARWLQREIEKYLFPEFADAALRVEEGQFTRQGDAASKAVESVRGADTLIEMAWRDFLPPFVLAMPPGSAGRPIGVFSTFFPARWAQVSINNRIAERKPWLEKRGDREASSACLAWSETWVKPRA